MSDAKRVREAQVVYEVGDAGKREPVAILPIANLGLRLTVQVTYADNQWSAHCPELELAVASDAQESVIHELAQLAIEYAAEYLADFDLYVNSANRAGQLPCILAIVRHTTDPEDVKTIETIRQLFDVEHAWVE